METATLEVHQGQLLKFLQAKKWETNEQSTERLSGNFEKDASEPKAVRNGSKCGRLHVESGFLRP